MGYPAAADCHKDACQSAEQQFVRYYRRWLAEPHGALGETRSNHAGLRQITEFAIGRFLGHSTDAAFSELWCDGVELVHCAVRDRVHEISGACTLSNREQDSMWLAPFALQFSFDADADTIKNVDLRVGHHGVEGDRMCKRYPTGRTYRLCRLAHSIYGSRPKADPEWAVIISLNPYPKC